MHLREEREGMHQNGQLRIHSEIASKISIFGVRNR